MWEHVLSPWEGPLGDGHGDKAHGRQGLALGIREGLVVPECLAITSSPATCMASDKSPLWASVAPSVKWDRQHCFPFRRTLAS